jgi:hypothetical protein
VVDLVSLVVIQARSKQDVESAGYIDSSGTQIGNGRHSTSRIVTDFNQRFGWQSSAGMIA